MRSASSRALASLYTSPGSSLSLALFARSAAVKGAVSPSKNGLGDPGALPGLDAVEQR